MLIPTVVDKTSNGERSYDIFSRLLEDRIIFISGEIDDGLANTVIAELLFLDSKNSQKQISVYINSPGGVTTAGLAIIDTMHLVKSPVSTICVGLCASAAALILAAGDKGKRFILEHGKVMIHQPWGGVKGQISEIEIYLKEGQKDKNTYAELLAKYTGKNIKQVLKDIDRDNYKNAEEAVSYGICDSVLKNE